MLFSFRVFQEKVTAHLVLTHVKVPRSRPFAFDLAPNSGAGDLVHHSAKRKINRGWGILWLGGPGGSVIWLRPAYELVQHFHQAPLPAAAPMGSRPSESFSAGEDERERIKGGHFSAGGGEKAAVC